MTKGAPSQIATDVQLISALIAGIDKGEIKVPKFQRAFVWKDDQALNLLDSIANNYPVGSLLLWRTHDKLLAERSIGEFSLPATDDMDPTDYVLDGQQRLTVIYSCLGAKEADGVSRSSMTSMAKNSCVRPRQLVSHTFPCVECSTQRNY